MKSLRKYGQHNDSELNEKSINKYLKASELSKNIFNTIHDRIISEIDCEVRSSRQDWMLIYKPGRIIPLHHTIKSDKNVFDVMLVSVGGIIWPNADNDLKDYRQYLIKERVIGQRGHGPDEWNNYAFSTLNDVDMAVRLAVRILKFWKNK
jgi:hypothetical protein